MNLQSYRIEVGAERQERWWIHGLHSTTVYTGAKVWGRERGGLLEAALDIVLCYNCRKQRPVQLCSRLWARAQICVMGLTISCKHLLALFCWTGLRFNLTKKLNKILFSSNLWWNNSKFINTYKKVDTRSRIQLDTY